MSNIWPLKNLENRSVTRAIKNAYLKKHQPLRVKTLKTFNLTFVAYSSNMTSEMTQFTVFSRLCQKSHIFRLFLNSAA